MRQGTTKRRMRAKQAQVGFTNWGGKRKGAGRKPKGEIALVSHERRAECPGRYPRHVTLKLERGLPSLRRRAAYAVLERALAQASERFGFRVVHFTAQSNHVHLLVEAEDTRSLSRGMKGLAVRLARSLNRLWERSGRIFADRFHARVLATPREVRNALRYLFFNVQKHGVTFLGGPDPFSSGEHFDGWRNGSAISAESSPRAFGCACTWLLRIGWKRHLLLAWNPAPLTDTR